VRIRPPAARLAASLWPEVASAGTPIAVRIELLAANGARSLDSSQVRVRGVPRGAFSPAETTVTPRDGVAWAYLQPRPVGTPGRVPARSVTVALLHPVA